MLELNQKRLERIGYSFINGEMVTSAIEVRSQDGAVEFCSEPAFAFRVRKWDGKWSPYVTLEGHKVLELARAMVADAGVGTRD